MQSPSTSNVQRTPGVQNVQRTPVVQYVQRTPGVQSTSNIFRTPAGPNVQRTPGQNTSYGFQTPNNQRSQEATQYSSQVIIRFTLFVEIYYIYN